MSYEFLKESCMVNGLKLYIPLDDLNNYIRNHVNEEYKNHTFIPVRVEVNELDFSVEMCLVTTTPIEPNQFRYKLDLDLLTKPKRKRKKVKEDKPLPGQISFFDEGEQE